MLEFIRKRRGTHDSPDDKLRDFDEFAELYRIACRRWSSPSQGTVDEGRSP
ncbi:MAG: hypothetical protein ACRDSI_19285 [Pseudonocardiaceae bacterium]